MIYMIPIGFLIVTIYIIADRIVTQKRLEENQIAWDDYCKNMTYEERVDYFFPWLIKREHEKGWTYMYIPQINHIKPNVFECKINGIWYKGTKEEISNKSGVSLYILNEFEILPMQIDIE